MKGPSWLKLSRKKKVHRFQHEISSNERDLVNTCAFCGRPFAAGELLLRCPVCSSYFHKVCARMTAAGKACPLCKDLVFLEHVTISR
jgi:hypothetical protein